MNYVRDFKAEVIAKINGCKADILAIATDYTHKVGANPTAEEREEIRRIVGGSKLLDKTILYINDQLPKPAENVKA